MWGDGALEDAAVEVDAGDGAGRAKVTLSRHQQTWQEIPSKSSGPDIKEESPARDHLAIGRFAFRSCMVANIAVDIKYLAKSLKAAVQDSGV